MNRLHAFFAALLLGSATLLSAEPDNGKLLPNPELLVPNHVFFELGGGLNFPLEFFSQGNIAMTGYGGNFFLGAGYNLSGWMLGIEYTHDQWGEGKGSYALMQNFKNNIVEFRIRRLLTQKSLHWLPGWLELAPGIGGGVNFITTDYYSSKRAKDEERMSSVSLFAPDANCFFYDLSFELSFFLGTDMVIPFAGINYNAFYDTSIGGGFAGFSRVYLGLRTYPLGIVNDVQRIRAAKKQREQEALKAQEEARRQEEEDRKEAARLREEEEKRKADEEEEAKAAALRHAELVASWEKPEASLNASPDIDFAPDENGIADTVTLTPGVLRLEHVPESWEIEITDPHGNGFKHWSGKGQLPEKLLWDGRSDQGELVFSRNVYRAELTVIPQKEDIDRTGSEKLTAMADIKTGILMQVIIPEKQWKIIVNTIHFDPDRATFDMIPLEQQQENQETLDSIARQIKQIDNVSVLIEGYANNVTNTEREDREELIPLSNLRAQAILGLLEERGLSADMLSAEGKGGAHPIAAWEDHENWWKNRRVEFIVTKED